MSFEVHSATAERWPDMVELFERRGVRGGHQNTPAYGCWCMYWRDRAVEHGERSKRAMGKLVGAGREPGLLAYDDGVPVGWVAVAPREEYRAIMRSPQYKPRDTGGGAAVWAIVCFTIDRQARGRGVAFQLLDAAVDYAFSRGATSVEAYAHASNPTDYMGHTELYRRAGFAHVRAANKRSVVRLER